jgi:hypothetical protein
MDLIRAMLQQVEANPHGFAEDIKIDGYTDEQIGYHSKLIGEAGLARVVDLTSFGCQSPKAKIVSLTWDGYEFLDNSRENQTWNQAKSAASKVGGASLQIMTLVLADLIKKKLGIL